jgi:hypothetical protein
MGGARSKHGGEEEVHTRAWRENLKERDQLEDLYVDGRTILKWILSQLGRHGLDWSGPEQWQVVGSSACSNKPSVFMQGISWLAVELLIHGGVGSMQFETEQAIWPLVEWLYLLTPWCRVLLEKLTGLQLVKKFPAFYYTEVNFSIHHKGERKWNLIIENILVHTNYSWYRYHAQDIMKEAKWKPAKRYKIFWVPAMSLDCRNFQLKRLALKLKIQMKCSRYTALFKLR